MAFLSCRSARALALAFAMAPTAVLATGGEPAQPRVLDGFEDAAPWRVVASNQVTGSLRQVDGVDGKALCLDYDFNDVSGYIGLQRDLPLQFPENYRFSFRLRGDSPANDLQFKLVDASGDNVWWVNRHKYAFPAEWKEVRYRKRHVSKAWGPDPDKTLRRSEKLEFTLYNNAGGAGSVCFDQLVFEALPPDPDTPPRAVAAQASASPETAALAIDGDLRTAWQASGAQRLVLDLGQSREFGGLRLHWSAADARPTRYRIELEDARDGRWREVRRVDQGAGPTDWIALPEAESRRIALALEGGRYALAEAQVQPLSFSAHPNDFLKALAADLPRGWLPRGFTGEQPYWTIVGIDGGLDQGLIGEDGAVEVARGGFSIEPFVLDGRTLLSWADVRTGQGLRTGGMPMPNVTWALPDAAVDAPALLDVLAFAQGTPQDSQLVMRYRLTNPHPQTRDFTLALAVRPLQVNPPSQFLSTVGGVSEIHGLTVREASIGVDGVQRVHASRKPQAAFASAFDSGDVVQRLADMEWASFLSQVEATGVDHPGLDAGEDTVNDPTGLASGALLYRAWLAPGETCEVDLIAPMTGGFENGVASGSPEGAEVLQKHVADQWRGKLDRVHIEVPPQGRALVDTLRTATAHMLISRIGPRLQPGTRSYARSWIRDGAMISEGLLRMGREDVARDYVDFYAPYQFENGKVPCCVDDRGSDPVPENDSHGELIFNIAELYRYNKDKAFLQKMWPHVLGAWTYMEKLRLSERTEANRELNPAFYGMMPASISHEGYSAKPMHSYWDNFWALRGYKDAVEVAQWLGKVEDAKRFAVARDQFRDDLYDSLRAAAKLHDIDFLPGAAELGDFDATSTTIALAPGGEQGRLPRDLLDNTFERYWREFEQRRDGKREWKDYTPYEWRNVAAFVRLGWRERAWEAVRFFFKDRAPQPWNQWAEVVSRTPRKPFFVGDLPHAWVASDFVRSALDMFAYSREIDDSIVLAAGIPADWLEGEGIAIADLRTPQGNLGYSLSRNNGSLRLQLRAAMKLPAGGLVLPWPYQGEPGKAMVNGKPVAWKDGELRILSLPAVVDIDARHKK